MFDFKEHREYCTGKIPKKEVCQILYLENLKSWCIRYFPDTKDCFTVDITNCPFCGIDLSKEGIRYCPFDGNELYQWMKGNYFDRFKCKTCGREYAYLKVEKWFTEVSEEVAIKLEKGLF
jgi:hypothetical protein